MKLHLPRSLAWCAVLGVVACRPPAAESGAHEKPAEAHQAEAKSEKTGSGPKLSPEQQKLSGIATARTTRTSYIPHFTANARVLDPVPLAQAMVDLQTAEAAQAASTRELARLQTLFAQDQNASVRALEAGAATVQRDRLLVDLAQQRLRSGWGKVISAQTNLSAFAHTLTDSDAALVRLDVPLGQGIEGAPSRFELSRPGDPSQVWMAEILGAAPTADAQAPGRSWFAWVASNPPPVGSALIATLRGGGEPQEALEVPSTALLRHEGGLFVFVQIGADQFERRAVTLLQILDHSYLVASDQNIRTNDVLVVTGAQQVLSEELKSRFGAEE